MLGRIPYIAKVRRTCPSKIPRPACSASRWHIISVLNRLSFRWNFKSSPALQQHYRRSRRWRNAMKKFLLITVGLIALGIAAPASAADLAARPYTKAPPAPVVAVYDWTGVYIGANGGGGWSHKCWDVTS